MNQPTFADLDYESKKRKTRREKFLERMDGLIPWEELEERIRPFYPKAGRGRRPYELSVMLRIHCVQLFYNLSDPGMEDMLYEVESVRRFVGLRLPGPLPDETTILNFRHLLEEHELGAGLFEEINRYLESKGLRLQEGTIVYAPDLSDDEILTRLQHLGGKTNLIDFTRDLNIALFFGSYHSPDKNGRVILMDEAHVLRDNRPAVSRDRRPLRDRLVPRGNPASMTDVQKSVWVEPWRGYITDESVTIVEIPSALKSEILWHLRVVYGIEASSVYNDLSGFIRDQDRFRDHEAEWYAGLRAYQAGHYERALAFFAQYEQLVEEPESSLEYFRGILYWNIDRNEEALAAMARFRSRSPRDARAFPEEIESAYFERRHSPDADRRRIERDEGTPVTEVFPGFCIRPVGRDAGGPVRHIGIITHETGASQQVLLELEKDAFVAFPDLTPDAGGTWRLSLQWKPHDDSEPLHWPIRETLVLKAYHGDARDVTVEIESLQYTYEPDISGPFVAYPARAEDGGGSTA